MSLFFYLELKDNLIVSTSLVPVPWKMTSEIERFKLSKSAKDQLSKLKRYTKIDQWNILCRWAFCRSLAEPTQPSPVPIPADSNVEMTWRVFGGELADILLIALKRLASKAW